MNDVTKTATYFLGTAATTLAERGKQYDKEGKQERSMAQVVNLFNALFPETPLTEYQGWRFMQFLKMVRGKRAPHEDSELDNTAYAAIAAECRMAEPANVSADKPKELVLRQPYQLAPEQYQELLGLLHCIHGDAGKVIDKSGLHAALSTAKRIVLNWKCMQFPHDYNPEDPATHPKTCGCNLCASKQYAGMAYNNTNNSFDPT